MAGNNTEGLLIGFDLGTSAVKALLSDADGRIIGQAERRVRLIRGEGGSIELDPEAYYRDICSVCRELVSAVPGSERIRAVCFSGASGNTVFLDRDFNPLGNAVSWMDSRAVGMDEELFPGFDTGKVYARVGWPFGGTFPLAHMGWNRHFREELWKQTRHLCMLNDYIYYRLSGRLAVDYSKATTFFLQNQEEKRWDEELIGLLGVKKEMLSDLLPPGTVCGGVSPEASTETGLESGTPVVTGSFDHPSAARGTGVFEEGDILISAGTSWVAFAPVRERKIALSGRMLIDPFLSPSGCWGSMFALTAVAERMNEYLVNRIGSADGETMLERYNRLAAEAEPGAGGFYLELFKQPWEQMKEKVKDVADKNIARALMEGIAFLMRSRIEALVRLTGKPVERIVLTGGPTKSAVWPAILADVLGRSVAIPATGQHAGAMGAVILAGIGAGIFSDEQDGYQRIKPKELMIGPDPDRSRLYEEVYKEYAEQFELNNGIE